MGEGGTTWAAGSRCLLPWLLHGRRPRKPPPPPSLKTAKKASETRPRYVITRVKISSVPTRTEATVVLEGASPSPSPGLEQNQQQQPSKPITKSEV